jgi:threonine synthase
VVSVAINGEFDDCQRLAKEAFAQEGKFKNQTLCSANSINIGRLLPQATYYAWSSQRYFLKHGMQTSFIIPTGNLGNAFACFIAKEMGFPIENIVFATNANRTIPDFLETGFWQPRPTTPTLASAMDVGNPSNMERFFHVFDNPETLLDTLRAVSVTDEQITNQISSEYLDNQILCCPHTATALHVYREFSNKEKKETHWCIVATAHPSKFEQTVEPIIGEEIAVPERLRALLELDSSYVTIDPELNQLIDAIASA